MRAFFFIGVAVQNYRDCPKLGTISWGRPSVSDGRRTASELTYLVEQTGILPTEFPHGLD